MTELVRQRCANHAAREAVSKCIGCARFFCRECVTEHGEQMLCSACLSRAAVPAIASKRRDSWLMLVAMGTAGFLIVWALFYWAGDLVAGQQ